MEQETRPGRLMFIFRDGSRAGQSQAASPPSGCELRPRHCGSVPAPPGRAGASRPPAARAGAGAAADNGGRAGGGRADSTSLPGPPSAALPSERLRDGRGRKWSRRRDRGRCPFLGRERHSRPMALLPPAPASCRTDGGTGSAGNNSGRAASCPGTAPSATSPPPWHPGTEPSATSPPTPHQRLHTSTEASAPRPRPQLCPLLRALYSGIKPSALSPSTLCRPLHPSIKPLAPRPRHQR